MKILTWLFCVVALMTMLVVAQDAKANMADDIQCHTDNIFYEANSEDLLGMVLVANSVMNRTKNPERWGPDSCSVIYQPYQYSWTLLRAGDLHEFKQREAEGYRYIKANIGVILSHGPVLGFGGVNHYLRCDSRKPGGWWEDMQFLGQHGAHCFYKD